MIPDVFSSLNAAARSPVPAGAAAPGPRDGGRERAGAVTWRPRVAMAP